MERDRPPDSHDQANRISDTEAEIRGIRALARTLPHEFGQPLTELLGYAELLRTGRYSSDEQQEILYELEGAAARLGQLMRAVARLADEGWVKPRRYQHDGRELVDLQLPPPGPLSELRSSAAQHLEPDAKSDGPPWSSKNDRAARRL